eukprot:TRINITY_DN7715_c0_g1_i6.p1 TRINITY_DN7715_c0_g1~~TRINITY_DN7715_c0_g1_i6.p1  ORF type:complete len:1184 (+),score=297.27 TRINITY_DN7715_c0_g1_i6:1285-4836(+)
MEANGQDDVVMVLDDAENTQTNKKRSSNVRPAPSASDVVKKKPRGGLVTDQQFMEIYALTSTVPCKMSTGKNNTNGKIKCAMNPNCIHALISPITKKTAGIWKKSETGALSPFQHLMLHDSSYASWALAEREPPESPVGMRNLGATCYMNCLLQCLFMNKRFRNGIFLYDESAEGGHHTVHQLQLLFGQLLLSKRKFVDPSDLVQHLKLETSLQQDVQEFNRLFLCHLEHQLKQSPDHRVVNLVHDLFGGSLSYVTMCDGCKARSEQRSAFFDLTLQLKGMKTLHQALACFFAEEVLEGPNQYFCSYCAAKRNVRRRVELSQTGLPKYLNIQLMRFVFDLLSMQKVKVKSKIEIPLILPCAAVTTLPPTRPQEYRLTAVFQHLGESAYSGHYAVDIFDEGRSEWFKFDDEKVTPTHIGRSPEADSDVTILDDPSKIVSSNAYMLVYKLHYLDEPDISVLDVPPAPWIVNSVAESNRQFAAQVGLHKHQQAVVREFMEERKSHVNQFLADLDEVYSSDVQFVEQFRDPRNLVVVTKEWLKHWMYGTAQEEPDDEEGDDANDVVEIDVDQTEPEKDEIKEDESNKHVVHVSPENLEEEKSKFTKKLILSSHPGLLKLESSLLCQHELLTTEKSSGELKVLSKQLWNKLHVDQEPKLFLDYCCEVCASDKISGMEEGKAVGELADHLLALLKSNTLDEEVSGFWLSRSWLTKLKKCVSTKKNYDVLFSHSESIPSTNVVDLVGETNGSSGSADLAKKPSIFLDNALQGVRCSHGNLSADAKPRKLVSFETVSAMLEFLHKTAAGLMDCSMDKFMQEGFPAGAALCEDCSRENSAKVELQSHKNEEMNKLRPLYVRKSAENFPELVAAPNPGTYYLIPYGWYCIWKQYLSDLHVTARPGPIAFDSLLCPHSLLSFNPVPLVIDESSKQPFADTGGCPSGVMVPVKESEWQILNSLYATSGTVPHVMVQYVPREGCSPDGVSFPWENLDVITSPEICLDCIQARIEEERRNKRCFIDGEITVVTISSEPTAELQSSASSSGRRSRRSRAANRGGKQRSILVDVSSSDTLGALKLKIFEQLDIDPLAQRLFLGTKELGKLDGNKKSTRRRTGDNDDDDDQLVINLTSHVDEDSLTLESLGITNHCTVHLLKEEDEEAYLKRQMSALEASERAARSNEPEVGFRGTMLFS